MPFPFFKGKGSDISEKGWKAIPPSRQRAETLPEFYEADAALIDAVNTALLMGRPLLLTGDPGTGKTQLAFRLAWELGLGKPEVFETKSDSSAKDLFYTWDALGRFHDAYCSPGKTAKETATEYITFNALGRAILLSLEKEKVRDLLPENNPDFIHDGPRRSVVLIDEIDKAPRDFPNDILNEIEQMYFRIPELGNRRVPDLGQESDLGQEFDYTPIVIITSNSEKHLPGPFLRRCAYHHITFPEPKQMERIVLNRLRHIPDQGRISEPSKKFIEDATALFFHLKKEDKWAGLSTGELIAWIQAMRESSDKENPVADDRDVAARTISLLVKSGDSAEIRKIVKEW
ncbi:MAG: MoxR family ATPase [Desulfococcaceae bacterium]|jgi:MoxR-like ATPase|nr:MoxR family ATPase [Desulfococcaceae bacterium]